MSKAGDIAKISAKGSFNLLWGLVISTIISSLGTIFIARLLGSDLYGLYTIILTVPAVIQIFREWGINFAMVRFIAQFRAQGRIDEISSIYLSGIIFELIMGLGLSIFSFFFADFFATVLFNRPTIAPLIRIASFSIFAGGIITAATATFTGYERMQLNSLMLICQSAFKTTIVITLVILGLGTAGATVGFTVSTFAAGAIGIALTWVIYRHLPKPHKPEIRAYLSTMLTYCLPVSLAVIITSLLPQFYSFLLPIFYATDNVQIGNYGVAMNFVVLITFFATPVGTMMFPAFSKLDAKTDKEHLKNIFQFSVKYASLFVVPVTVLVICLSQPAVETLFGDTYNTASLFFALFAIQYLYTALGNLSLASFLNGQGRTSYVLKMALLTGAIGFPLGFFLIMNFGVLGLILTTLVAGLPSLFMGLRFIKKTYNITVDWNSSLRILVSSSATGVLTYLLVMQLPFASWVLLIIGVIFFVLALVPLVLLTRAITILDIANFKSMVGSLGAIGGLINRVLVLLETLIKMLKIEC